MPADGADTLFFIDVDGVLNVGIRDGHQSPLLLDKKSIDSALSLYEVRERHPERNSIERLASVVRREVGQGEPLGATYEPFACTSTRQYSEMLVGRLSKLLSVAGWQPESADRLPGQGSATAVLTSTWRAPQYRSRLKQLESVMGRQMGTDFAFDDKTHPKEEHTPEGRVRSIRAYLQEVAAERLLDPESRARPLRVVVVDDFYNRPLNGFSVAGTPIQSATDLETALKASVPAGLDVDVKVLHTFMEWTTTDGLAVQVGCGICQDHLQAGLDFIEQGFRGMLSKTSSPVMMAKPSKLMEQESTAFPPLNNDHRAVFADDFPQCQSPYGHDSQWTPMPIPLFDCSSVLA